MPSHQYLNSVFWRVCIPVRLGIATMVWFLPDRWLPLVGLVAIIGAVYLMYRFLTFEAKQEGIFGQPVVWNHLRPMHALVWVVFAYLAFMKNPHAKILQFGDVLLGAVAHSLL